MAAMENCPNTFHLLLLNSYAGTTGVAMAAQETGGFTHAG